MSEITAHCSTMWSDVKKIWHIAQQYKHCLRNYSTSLGNVSIILQRTSTNYTYSKRLNQNHISVESAFNFYVNERIAYLLETPVNTKSTRETFYHKLIQNTSLPTNYNFASIITEINKKIEHYTQQRYPITYASKDKGKLQTPIVTPKQIQPSTWKKTRVKSSTNLSYYYTPGSAINITSTGIKQRKKDLLGPYGVYFEGFKATSLWKVTKSEEEQEKEEEESEDQEFTYQNLIPENPNIETPNFQTQQNLNFQTQPN
ncbi:hypothetical protein G9A89_011568 [Geosiphon pyriformis]|nr:hypothetical protein G9A89_011568 [Geosiphon pyriformis]